MNKFLHFISVAFLGITSLQAQVISGNVKDFLTTENLENVMVEVTDVSSNIGDTLYTDFFGNWSYQITSVAEVHSPSKFIVDQNYPNPFNPATNISFSIDESEKVTIIIHDILGRIVDKKEYALQNGNYTIRYEGMGSAGIYFYTIRTATQSVTKKMNQLDGSSGIGLTSLQSTAFRSKTNLGKTTDSEVRIVCSKYTYVSDTLVVTVGGGENISRTIEPLHFNATLVDLHNDILERIFMVDPNYNIGEYNTKFETDIPRLKMGGVDLQFFAAWVSPSAYSGKYFNTTVDMIEKLDYEAVLNANDLSRTNNYISSMSAIKQNKIAAVIGVEGGHSIENSMDKLVQLYNMGMRYLTITWNNSTDWAISASDSRTSTVGLSDFGKDVIRKMDSLGILIDISHTGIKTITDILEITQNPIVATHSGVRAIKNHSRNLYDNQIRSIANSGGVIGIVFYPPFIGDANNDSDSDIDDVIAHIDYIVNLVGIDHVALGSDFDGTGGNLVSGLDDVTKFPVLTKALLDHGYTQTEVRKILGENFLRVFQQVCN